MNNRQKAKHWKRLYETTLPKRCLAVYETLTLQHFKACYMMPRAELDFWKYNPDRLTKVITDRLIEQLKPDIQERIICQKDYLKYSVDYTVDIWLKKIDQ